MTKANKSNARKGEGFAYQVNKYHLGVRPSAATFESLDAKTTVGLRWMTARDIERLEFHTVPERETIKNMTFAEIGIIVAFTRIETAMRLTIHHYKFSIASSRLHALSVSGKALGMITEENESEMMITFDIPLNLRVGEKFLTIDKHYSALLAKARLEFPVLADQLKSALQFVPALPLKGVSLPPARD